jgi:hypothetical protein
VPFADQGRFASARRGRNHGKRASQASSEQGDEARTGDRLGAERREEEFRGKDSSQSASG